MEEQKKTVLRCTLIAMLFMSEIKHKKNRINNKRKRKQLKKYKNELKSNGCSRCGNKGIKTIEFHHVNGKSATIGSLSSITKINNELKKHVIVLLCKNCHAEIHGGVAELVDVVRVLPIAKPEN